MESLQEHDVLNGLQNVILLAKEINKKPFQGGIGRVEGNLPHVSLSTPYYSGENWCLWAHLPTRFAEIL